MSAAFCSAPGCVEPAEGYVALAYVHEWKRYLCADHMRPIRGVLAALLRAPAEIVPPSPPARQSPELAPTR